MGIENQDKVAFNSWLLIAKLVNSSNFTMVYGTYNLELLGLLDQLITGVPHIVP